MSNITEKTYVQGGADWDVKYPARKSKAELKKFIKADPSSVYLYATSSMGPQFSDTADKLPEGMVFNVVGPDPYTKRDWYASVFRNTRGGITVQ
jgi:hypothetical protein